MAAKKKSQAVVDTTGMDPDMRDTLDRDVKRQDRIRRMFPTPPPKPKPKKKTGRG